MRGFVLAAALLAAGSACADTIKCEGPFGPDTSHARLAATFGADNVTRETIEGVEGDIANYTIVFAADPSRRLEFLWANEEAGEDVVEIRIPWQSDDWVHETGIRNGASLEDVEKINGNPFTLLGFGWDLGGGSLDWQNGRLASLPGKCSLRLFFSETPGGDGASSDAVSGDHVFSSSDPKMKAVHPRVDTWRITYEDPASHPPSP